MKGTAYIIDTDGIVHTSEFDGEVPGLAFHNEAVGGYLEKVPGWDAMYDDPGKPCVVYCNEEGKGMGLEPNIKATAMWLTALRHRGHTGPLNDVLVGRVLVLTGDREWMGEL